MRMNLTQSPPGHNPAIEIFYLSMADLQQRTRFGKSYLYKSVQEGLFPPGISIGSRSTRWIATEVAAIQRAWARGASSNELHELVRALVAAR